MSQPLTVLGAAPAPVALAPTKEEHPHEKHDAFVAWLKTDAGPIPRYGYGIAVAGLGAAYGLYKHFHKKGRR